MHHSFFVRQTCYSIIRTLNACLLCVAFLCRLCLVHANFVAHGVELKNWGNNDGNLSIGILVDLFRQTARSKVTVESRLRRK
jgi:hypothetical protein